ncbi:MAG: DUF3793 family protein [Oscillospiraceae bacterium]|nr:DUF3793 family protein [Oscillospiraceae bacterium]
MSEDAIIRNCAPTLAGIKTGNLFRYSYACADDMREAVRRWNRVLREKGVRILPLRFCKNHALIYVYRPSKLTSDLQNADARRILRHCGYCTNSADICIVELIRRLRASDDAFPHEIGLFLGYPPEDVSGFIEQKACGYKCVGCWKVYGDEQKCRQLFAKYKKCTRVYEEQLRKGVSVQKMTVSCKKAC